MRQDNRVAHGSLQEETGRIIWVDAAKGLSILLVMFHHASLTSMQIGEGWTSFSALDALCKPIRMPLFFAIAGLFSISALSRPWAQLLTGRVANLIWLYSLWTVIYWLFFRLFDPTDGLKPLGLSKWQLIYMWIIPPSGQWFLWLMAIYLILAKAAAPFRSPLHLAMLFIAAALCAEPVSHFPIFAWRNALLYAPFFIAGAWYGRTYVQWAQRRPWLMLIGGGSAFALIWTAAKAYPSLGPALQMGLSIAGLAAATGLARIASHIDRIRMPLVFCGQRTLSLYLGHGLAMAALSMLLPTLPLPDHALIWVTPLLMLFSLFASLALHNASGVWGQKWLYSSDGIRQLWLNRATV